MRTRNTDTNANLQNKNENALQKQRPQQRLCTWATEQQDNNNNKSVETTLRRLHTL